MKRKLIYLLYQHFDDKRLLFGFGFLISTLMFLFMYLLKREGLEVMQLLFFIFSITFVIIFFFTLGQKGFEISRQKKMFEYYLNILNNDLSTIEQKEKASLFLIDHPDITEEVIWLIIEENENNEKVRDLALDKYNSMKQKNNSS